MSRQSMLNRSLLYLSRRGLARVYVTPFCVQFLYLTILACSASAEVYRFVDSSGIVHYVSNLKDVPSQYHDQIASPHNLPEITRVTPATPTPSATPSITAAPERRNGNSQSLTNNPRIKQSKNGAGGKRVEIFVTSWCPYCKQLEEFLKEQRISYTRYDIEKNREGMRKYQELGRVGVPLVKIGSQIIPGFEPEAILQAVRRRRSGI